MSRYRIAGLWIVAASFIASAVHADDWTRFRGPNGTGISNSSATPPIEWGDSKNLKWKIALPGPGSSSPIVVGDKVFLTCWTGYATDQQDLGNQEDLQRHLICIDRKNGEALWQKSVPAVLPEDNYGGMFAENGYATHTPVSDGKRVFAFFGKSGVHAYDMEGNHLWSANVGTDLDSRRWGSASSPILYKNLLIVPAVVENHALVALNVEDGKEVWKQEAEGFGNCWGTPILVDLDGGKLEIVMVVPMEVWAFDPETGKLNWHANGPPSDSMCSSVVAADGVVYAIESGPRGGGSVAIRTGGKGDVSESHVVWSGRGRNRIGTPVIQDGRLYYVAGKVVNCLNASDGSSIYEARLEGGAAAPAAPPPAERGGRRGGRGMGGQDYSSPVVSGQNMYYTARDGTVFVVELSGSFKQLATNKFSDDGDFSATPAISDGEIYLRSSKHLYCIANTE